MSQSGSDKLLVNKALTRRAGIPVEVSTGVGSQVQSTGLSARNTPLPVSANQSGHEQAIQ